VLQTARAVRAELARDLDAVGLAELRAQRMRNQVQRRLVHRAAVDRIERAGIGLAIGLEAALEQDDHARLAARRRPEQQQQASANFGTGARRLEVVEHATDRVVDAEELVLEELAAELAVGEALVESVGAQHVPHVLMAGAYDALGIGAEHTLEEIGERAAPARGAMILGELDERLKKV